MRKDSAELGTAGDRIHSRTAALSGGGAARFSQVRDVVWPDEITRLRNGSLSPTAGGGRHGCELDMLPGGAEVLFGLILVARGLVRYLPSGIGFLEIVRCAASAGKSSRISR